MGDIYVREVEGRKQVRDRGTDTQSAHGVLLARDDAAGI